MPDQRIDQLTELTTPAFADEFIIWDDSASETKKITRENLLSGIINVKDYGAKGDGVTDDTTAIQTALDSGTLAVFMPEGSYVTSATLNVPANVTLFADTPTHSNGASPTRILGGLSITPVVSFNGGAGSRAGSVRGIEITRAAGTVPAGSIGYQINSANNVSGVDLLSSRHAIGYEFLGGLGSSLTRCRTHVISENHVIINNVPEVAFFDCRFGTNGSGDVAATNYVLITGTDPNTINFIRCQFNLGVNTVTNCVNFVGVTGSNGIFNFEACHFEGYTNVFASDSVTVSLRRLSAINCTFIDGSDPLFNLDAATQIVEGNFIGCLMAGTVEVINPDRVQFTGCRISGAFTCTGGADAIANVVGNVFLSDTALSGAWDALAFVGNTYRGVAVNLNDTATGTKTVFGNTAAAGAASQANVLDGELTLPNQPSFLANNSASDLNVTGNNTIATIDFDTEVFDQGADFAADTFTAPITGRYLLTASVRFGGHTTAADEIELRLVTSNRSYFNRQGTTNLANMFLSIEITAVVDMDANDTATIALRVFGEGSDTVDITGDTVNSTRFSGCLLA